MARDHAIVRHRFWTGRTGKSLRGDPEAQVLAQYLMSCPSSNMIGLYYLPIPMIAHETGLTFEGASKGLRRLSDGGFAHYDNAEEVVWVVNMAREQIGKELKAKDKRQEAIVRQWQEQANCAQYLEFHTRYATAFHLPDPKPTASRSEGASEAPRSQGDGQGQDQGDGKGQGDGFKSLAAEQPAAPPAQRKRRAKVPPAEALDLVTVTRAAATAMLAGASGGRYIDTPPEVGAVFRLDAARKAHPDGAIFARIGQWLAAGGDGWRGQLDGRNLGDLPAWIGQAQAWNGRPIERQSGSRVIGAGRPSEPTESGEAF